jgi:8-amino-7-oxononanoate synthase
MPQDIAIIGMGARFPGAADLIAYRSLLRDGRVEQMAIPMERWDHARVQSDNPRHTNHTPARQAALMPDIFHFAPDFFGITPKRARIMDPQQRLILEVSRQALEDAGYAARRLADGKVGVYVGASSSDHRGLVAAPVTLTCDLTGRLGSVPEMTTEQVAAMTAAVPPIQSYTIVGQQLNMIAANVSQAFDFTGPAFAVDTACSSALAALHEAVWHLRSGVVEAALVGGVYVMLDPTMMVCFSRVGAISFTDECRPFQEGANGFVLGEGAGVVVLKRLEDAQAAGDRVLAVVKGIGMNNDGRGGGPLTPRAEGQAEVLRRAWADAGVEPSTVGLVEAHATATPVGDGIELEALNAFFGPHLREAVPLSSVKANIGHGLSSAGMASLIKATLAVGGGEVFPQPCAGVLRGEFTKGAARWRVPAVGENWAARAEEPRRAGVSAFGFGGTNVHVVLEQAPGRTVTVEAMPPEGWSFGFSAPDAVRLERFLGEVEAMVEDGSAGPADLAFTLSRRRLDAVGLSVVARSGEELREKLAAARVTLRAGGVALNETGGRVPSGGELVTLAPSGLVERRFWLIDEGKRQAAGRMEALGRAEAEAGRRVAEGDGFRRVAAAIAEVTAWSVDEVKGTQEFVRDLGFDSLTTLDFVTVLGRERPGLPPPPRTLFTSTLTVGELVVALGEERKAADGHEAGGVRVRFDKGHHPWLMEHCPEGRAWLPLAALVHAALASASEAGVAGLRDFRMSGPVELAGDSLVVSRESGSEGEVHLREWPGGVGLARATSGVSGGELSRLTGEVDGPGGLSLARFYAEYGFHGPALQALAEVPRMGTGLVTGRLRTSRDEVVILDGGLQLALYWTAARRGRSAVVLGFEEFRRLRVFPSETQVSCRAVLTGETGDELRGDFDFYDVDGDLLAQWRGVRAQMKDRATGGVADWPEMRDLAARKAALAQAGLAMPYFQSHEGQAGAVTRIGGRESVNFSSYDYLGLAGAAEVKAAAVEAVTRYGPSVSASRVASGERPLHGELERALSGFLGCEAALAMVSGHATNVAVIGHLLGPEDLVIHDGLAHDCIVSGARLSGARRLAFAHNDTGALEALLVRERTKARRTLIAVEGVYSMDGDLAPLAEIVALKRKHGALLLVDEAHSLGVVGATGRGVGEYFSIARDDVDLWMGTLSKTLASCGGYLAGGAVLIDYLRFTLPGFVYSVGLSPANAAAALAAVKLLAAEPERVARLRRRSDFFRACCREHGVDVGASAFSAVVPAIVGDSVRALRVAQAMGGRGINVQPIFYPAVEEGKARLRFFISAAHSEEQLRLAAEALGEELRA